MYRFLNELENWDDLLDWFCVQANCTMCPHFKSCQSIEDYDFTTCKKVIEERLLELYRTRSLTALSDLKSMTVVTSQEQKERRDKCVSILMEAINDSIK